MLNNQKSPLSHSGAEGFEHLLSSKLQGDLPLKKRFIDMRNSFAIRALGVLLLALGAFLAATGASAKTKAAPAEALFKDKTFDFGTVPERGGKVTHSFEFVNSGGSNLVIVDATAECGCTVPEFPEAPIAPGKTGVIKVTYNPLGRPGTFDKTVTVKTNGQPRKIRLKIKGRVQP